MKKFYFYLVSFFMLAVSGPIGGQTGFSGHRERNTSFVLKYPGSSETVEMSGSPSRLHSRKRADKPVMKINSEKELWGFLTFDTTEDYMPGMGTFALNNAGIFTTLWPSELNVSAGACAYDVMYLQTYSFDRPVAFYSIDLITGDEKKIVDYPDSGPVLRDMTYDYTTNTMYGVGGQYNEEVSFLYSVDLETGILTELFPLGSDLMTLAADSEGKIYGVTPEGDLYQVFVEDQYADIVGFTNEFPWYLQSMDFDRSDNTLYWAGFTEEGESFLATVDVETGEATRIATPLGENAEILALHVPSENQSSDTPAAPENLSVVPGEQGSLTVNLSWTNPLKTIAGNPLTALTEIAVYRNEEPVYTLDNPVLGETARWTDENVPESGYVVYKLIPSNEAGEGKPVKSGTVFVGKDVPGAVGDPVVVKEEGNYHTRISWTAPVSSMNGGWFDAASMTYDVIRYPDDRIIGENLTETSCRDETITAVSAYFYEIVPKTPDGKGVKAQTNKLFVGPAMSLPYFCNFSTEEARNLWVIDDANHDGYTWTFDSNYKGTPDWFIEYNIYNYDETPYIQADEWFFSAPVTLTAGRKYTLTFRVRLGGDLSQEKFRTVICSDANPQARISVIGDYTTLNDQNFQPVTSVFEVSESGDYHIGFQCYSDPDQWLVQITDISLEESFAKDMESLQIKGITAPVEKEATAYEVTIKNNGVENISSCQVQIIDENSTVLGTTRVTKELVPQESLIVEVKCSLPDAGMKKLSGRVVLDADEDPTNNVSPVLEVEVLPGDDFAWKYVGRQEKKEYTPTYPFMVDRRYSYSQSLYFPADLQFASGKIERLAYYYYIQPEFGKPAKNVSIRISMANTDVASLSEEYIPENLFTEVYRGILSLDSLNNVLLIDLDTPFEYIGPNLCILTERTGEEEEIYSGNYFRCTTLKDTMETGRTRFYGSLDTPFGPEVSGIVRQEFPNVSLLINKKESSVKGTERNAGLIVYPNPATDLLTIRGEYVTAVLYSVSGNMAGKFAGTGAMNVSGLARGVYLLHVNTGNDVVVYKIVLK